MGLHRAACNGSSFSRVLPGFRTSVVRLCRQPQRGEPGAQPVHTLAQLAVRHARRGRRGQQACMTGACGRAGGGRALKRLLALSFSRSASRLQNLPPRRLVQNQKVLPCERKVLHLRS